MAKEPAQKTKTESKGKEAEQQDAGTQPPAQPMLQVRTQYVKDLSFESPSAPQSFLQGGEAPQLDLGVNVNGEKIDDTHFELVLTIKATAKVEEKIMFDLELDYAGIFVPENVPAENLNAFLMIEGPRTLFPFARQVVSNVTREGGFMPLNLNPIDFVQIFRQNMAARAAAQNAETSPASN